ncbi:MAG: hypothetical protein ACP5MD_13685 [Verrucomicrobiia bacterium]
MPGSQFNIEFLAVALAGCAAAIKLASALETEILSVGRGFPRPGDVTGPKAWVYLRGWPGRFRGQVTTHAGLARRQYQETT